MRDVLRSKPGGIDDFFAPMPLDTAANRIKQHLLEAKQKGLRAEAVPNLGTVDLALPPGHIEELVDKILLDVSADGIRQAESVLAKLVDAAPEPSTQPDLRPEEFEALKAAFGGRLKVFSGADWTSGGYARYASTSTVALFVVDKEFERESRGYNGLQFLKDLVQRANSFCIVLTHESTAISQADDRKRFAAAAGIRAEQFSVIGKDQDRSGGVDACFGSAIFEVYAQFLTAQLTRFLANAITEGTLGAVDEIGSESVYDSDQAIFENSIGEGASEADVILRIFRSRQKRAVWQALKAAPLQSAIRKMRDFRTKTEAVRSRLRQPRVDLKAFRQWRFDEVFDDPTAVNVLHAPLVCGDLFDVTIRPGKVRRFILLAQPCALAVRGGKGRQSEIGLFVPVTVVESKKQGKMQPPESAPSVPGPTLETAPKPGSDFDEDQDESPYKFFDLKDVLDGERIWRVDFRSTIYVPLKVLDLTVYNEDGSAQLMCNHPEPRVTLLPGWKMRFDTACRTYPPVKPNSDPAKWKPAERLPSALGKGAKSLECDKHDGSILSYPIIRSGRVDAHVADAIYAAWATYQTRAALDHDFAKAGRCENDEDEGESTVAAAANGSVVPEGISTFQNSGSPSSVRETPPADSSTSRNVTPAQPSL